MTNSGLEASEEPHLQGVAGKGDDLSGWTAALEALASLHVFQLEVRGAFRALAQVVGLPVFHMLLLLAILKAFQSTASHPDGREVRAFHIFLVFRIAVAKEIGEGVAAWDFSCEGWGSDLNTFPAVLGHLPAFGDHDCGEDLTR